MENSKWTFVCQLVVLDSTLSAKQLETIFRLCNSRVVLVSCGQESLERDLVPSDALVMYDMSKMWSFDVPNDTSLNRVYPAS